MDVRNFLENADVEGAREALITVLERYTQPAFGSLPKRETDIMIFEVMRALRLLPEDASVYDLMTDLRITRAKASQLLFDTAIRKFDENPELLDEKVVKVLCDARFHHDADKYFVFEVEDPMVNANIKEKVRKAGHISDSSFNSALIRLPLDAVADLVADLLPEEKKKSVSQALVKAGAPKELSFKNVLKSSLKKLGKVVVGEVSDKLVDEAGKFLTPILRDGAEEILTKWTCVFKHGDDDNEGPSGGSVA